MAHGEQLPVLILHGVDAVHHGLVGGEHAPGGIVVLLLAQVCDRQVGQQVHKAALGLGDQGVAVGQEEDVFDPSVLQQHLHQGNDRSRLAGAGGHDQQGLPAIFLAEGLTHRLDGPLLVVPPGDVLVHLDVLQAGAHGAQVKELFQVPLGVEGGHLPLRVGPVVHAGVKAVGEEDHRPAAVFLFQQIGVQLGLLAALGRVHAGALGLDYSQRAVGVVVEHIVGIAHFALVGHSGQLYLVDPVLPLGPAGVGEHSVDVQLPGLVLGQVQGLGHIALPLFLPAGGELGLESPVLLHQGGQIHLRNRFPGLGNLLIRLGFQQRRVKLPLGVVLPVAVGDKVQEDVEVLQAQPGLLRGDLLPRVRGGVARLPDVLQPPPQVLPHDAPEVLGVHQAHQPVIVGHDQPAIHGVHPLDGKLHGPAAVHHAGRRVDGIDFFRRDSYLHEGGELGGGEEVGEVGHEGHLILF